MKITFTCVMLFVLGYILARYFPGPGNMIGLP